MSYTQLTHEERYQIKALLDINLLHLPVKSKTEYNITSKQKQILKTIVESGVGA